MPKNKNKNKGMNPIKKTASESRKKKRQEKEKAVKEDEEAIQKDIDESWWRRKRELEVGGLSPLEESPERTPEKLNDMLKNLNPQDRIRFVEDYKKDYQRLRKMKNPSSNKRKLTRRINSIKPTLIAAMKHRLNPHSTSIGTIHDDEGIFKFVENPSSGRSTKKKRKLSKKRYNKKKSQKKKKKKKHKTNKK